jgi:autotransporter-associated beta strand protein
VGADPITKGVDPVTGSILTVGTHAHGIQAQSLGGDGSSGGDGGAVTVNSDAAISTTGAGSNGIFARSLGGGATGSAGIVRVTQTGTITTQGDAADAIVAQSRGPRVGGDVTVTVGGGHITASGAGSNGIFAQSTGATGSGDIAVTITDANSTVVGGTGAGAAVRLADGQNNTITNYGTLLPSPGPGRPVPTTGGTSIVATGDGNTTINNFGTLYGSVDANGAGTNRFNNNAGGTFNAGASVDLGGRGTFTNAGTLSVAGSSIGTTTLNGDFAASGSSRWLMDLAEVGTSDRLVVNGGAKLGSSVTTVDLNEQSLPRSTGAYTFLTATGGGLTGANFQFGTLNGAMPLGKTFAFANTATTEQITLLPSTGPFYWKGATSSIWTTPFINGQSNWTRTGGTDYVFGTPGAASDVVFTTTGATSMGTDFTINSLRFTGAGGAHTLAGGNTLTLMASSGRGLTVDGGTRPTTVGTNIILGANQTWLNNGTSLTIAGATVAGSGVNLTVDGTGTTVIASAIQTRSGSLTKRGAGLLLLSGANTYSGGTAILDGTLQGNTTSLQGNILNNAALVFDQAASGTFAGHVDGTGTLEKIGNGTLRLTGRMTYSGQTTITGGVLQAGAPDVFSARSTTVVGGGTTLDLNGFDATIGALGGNGLVTLGMNTLTAGGNNASTTFAGTIAGTGRLMKLGAGVLTLTGVNTYSGGTAVIAGTLQGNTKGLQGDILNNAAVVFDQSGFGTYQGVMSGAGSLTKQGSGSLVLTGDSGGFGGTTNVSAGQLVVNGRLGGASLTLRPGAVLSGTGIVPDTTVQSGAALSPGAVIDTADMILPAEAVRTNADGTVARPSGSLGVFGNVKFEPGSTYTVHTDASGNSDHTLATGQLLSGGGTVDVQAGGTGRYHPINSYRIFSANRGVVGAFAGATSNLSYLNSSLQYDDQHVYLTLRRNDVDFRSTGTAGNQTAVAIVLNQLVATATGALADVVNNVYDLSNSDARQSMSSMTGSLYQRVARANLDVSQTFLSASMRRLRQLGADHGDDGPSDSAYAGALRSPASQSNSPGHGLWFSSLGGVTNYRGDAVDPGARLPLFGLMLGGDVSLGTSTTVGVSGGGATPELTLDGSPDHSTTHQWQLGTYGRIGHERSRLDASFGFSGQRNEALRLITDGATAVTTTSSYEGRTIASQLEYRYTWPIGRGFSIAPLGGLQLGFLKTDGFGEQRSSVLALNVAEHTSESVRTLFGAAASGAVGRMVVEGRSAWLHELRPLTEMSVRFQGDPYTSGFAVAAPLQFRDGALVGGDLSGTLGRGFQVFAVFDGGFGGPVTSWRANFGFDKSW